MRYSLLAPTLLLLGCATSSEVATGPNGGKLVQISGVGTAKVYQKAATACPRGYTIINQAQQGAVTFLDIECK